VPAKVMVAPEMAFVMVLLVLDLLRGQPVMHGQPCYEQ
jgi:hypothetical protein